MKKVRLKKSFDTGDFQIGAGVLKQVLWYITSMCLFRSGIMPFSSVLVLILRLFGAKIGKQVRIKPGAMIKYPWKLTIGDCSWLAECHIENLAIVEIGANCCISQYAILITGNHNYKKSEFDMTATPIILEDGVWIGAGCNVGPGVTAKSHSVLTLGSTISKDMEAYGIYAGNPAVKIRIRKIE